MGREQAEKTELEGKSRSSNFDIVGQAHRLPDVQVRQREPSPYKAEEL